MKTPTRHILTLTLLLAGAWALLPACGKSTVKSEKPAETVLNAENPSSITAPEATPVSSGTAEVASSSENSTIPVNTYVENTEPKKAKKAKPTANMTEETAAPVPTIEPTPVPTQAAPVQTPAMETAAPVKKRAKGGTSYLLWILLLAVVAGGGWYVWWKRHSAGSEQPRPPMGGLSPVSGFTGLKKRKDLFPPEKPSIWKKKIF